MHNPLRPQRALKPRIKAVLAMLAVTTVPLAACSEESQALTPEQKLQMEQVVRDYLVENPEVIIEALDAYRAKQEAAQRTSREQAMAHMDEGLKRSPNDPVLGNPDGDVTVVEFFDYRCGYCKRVFPDIQTLLEKDGNVRFVLKEFPILGPESVTASRAAQAVWLFQQEKYEPFHVAMMENRGALDEMTVFALAEDAGVNVEQMKEQMDDPKVMDVLRTNAQQAEALGINGTPAFIIGDMMQPGAISLDMMEQMIDAMRDD